MNNDFELYNSPISLSMVLDGQKMRNEYDLRAFSVVLYELTSIIDSTYCILSDQKRMNKNSKSVLQIKASNIYPGSIHIDFELIMNTIQLMAPIIGLANPYTIWQYIVNSYNLLKTLGTKIKSGEKPSIKIDNSSDSINVIGTNNSPIIVNQTIINIAGRSRKSFKNISESLCEDGIETFKIHSNNEAIKDDIYMNHLDKGSFNTPSIMSDEVLMFDANIKSLNKETLTGRLIVLDNQSIPQGEYAYKVIGEPNKDIYISALSKNTVQVTALTENKLDNIKGLVVKKLHIIKVIVN